MPKEIMGFDAQFLKQVKSLFQETSIEELEIAEGEDVYFRVSRKKETPPASLQANTIPVMPAVVPSSPQPVSPAPTPTSPQAVSTSTTSPYDDETKYYKIKSPIVGTFYEKPSPDSAPFVKIGDIVSPDTTVAIVEAMKVMNEIKAEVKGKIVQILKADASPVQANEPLFIVEKM
ncbi:acetyl-CoA carboxylase biotin carboxyl carrier protein [Thermospira aquatica]|uniref:Biotin carboxyl carrier protein of acetyl-CoA carboxylase n=1 Tax=Thermospira aquatica TaxID=2828656 RepID=A0AAX3BFL5_9SPIR|nr:acetyl-CoA carboxylase biotin carboxyl carrier protein [Thermospira aquatica]URA11085.1 acetyl-CoA carboxylase biotin carboxyl carrier protein [Thermospira aquatica]